jgi:Zn-dependent protease
MVRIRFEPAICLVWAFLLILFPLPWLLSAVLAALIHELCHLMMVILLGGGVTQIHVGVIGARIDADMADETGSFLAVLAGPLGSLLLSFLYIWEPRLAVCGLVQGIWNLLPFRTLDGGRLLEYLRQYRPGQ